MLDNFDVGVLVPYVRISVNGASRIYGQSNDELQRVLVDASASGLGDIAIFGKYRFWTLSPTGGQRRAARRPGRGRDRCGSRVATRTISSASG